MRAGFFIAHLPVKRSFGPLYCRKMIPQPNWRGQGPSRPSLRRVRQVLAVERLSGFLIPESHRAPGSSLEPGEGGFNRTLVHAQHDDLLATRDVGVSQRNVVGARL